MEKIIIFMILSIFLSFIPKIDYIIDKLSKFFMIISSIALISLTFIVTYDILARKLFSYGSIALQEFEWHLFDIIFLFSIAYTLSHNKHVRVDIFYEKFPFRLKKIIDLISILFFVIPLSILITFESIPFVEMSYLQNESSADPGGLCCRWIIKSSIIVAFVLVYLQSIAEIRKILYLIKNK